MKNKQPSDFWPITKFVMGAGVLIILWMVTFLGSMVREDKSRKDAEYEYHTRMLDQIAVCWAVAPERRMDYALCREVVGYKGPNSKAPNAKN